MHCYKSIQFLLAIMMATALLFTPNLASAKSSGAVGFNYSQVIDDTSTGLNAEYEYQGEMFIFEIDGDLQSGDIHRGKGHAEVTLGTAKVRIKLIADTTAKGYTLETMGRDTNGHIALNIPISDSGANIDIGIGGKQATPWGSPNAVSDLVPKGYDEEQLLALGLDQITPEPSGLPFQDGASLNGYLATGFKRWGIDADIKGILQLTGEDKAHQAHLRLDWRIDAGRLIDTNWFNQITQGKLSLNIGWELGLMQYREAIHYENALFTGIGLAF